ncbi:MAG: GxxExxY protein [Candidatus Woesearchaeota archaeon]
MKEYKVTNKELIYPDLCYKIVGILFDVWKEVGWGHKEHFYQKATEVEFKNKDINFESQVLSKVYFKEKPIGAYYFDFLIDNKIVLEFKVRNYFSKKDIEQVYSYLKSRDLKLGIIAHFTKDGVKFKRIVNLVNS